MAKKTAPIENDEIENEEIEEAEELPPAPPIKKATPKAPPTDLFENVPKPPPREKPFNQIDFSPIFEKIGEINTRLDKLTEGKAPPPEPKAPQKDLIEQLGEIF